MREFFNKCFHPLTAETDQEQEQSIASTKSTTTSWQTFLETEIKQMILITNDTWQRWVQCMSEYYQQENVVNKAFVLVQNTVFTWTFMCVVLSFMVGFGLGWKSRPRMSRLLIEYQYNKQRRRNNPIMLLPSQHTTPLWVSIIYKRFLPLSWSSSLLSHNHTPLREGITHKLDDTDKCTSAEFASLSNTSISESCTFSESWGARMLQKMYSHINVNWCQLPTYRCTIKSTLTHCTNTSEKYSLEETSKEICSPIDQAQETENFEGHLSRMSNSEERLVPFGSEDDDNSRSSSTMRSNVTSHDVLLLQKQSFDVLYHTQCQTPIWCGYILTEQSVNATRKYNRCSKLFPDYSIPVRFRRQRHTLWYDDYDKSHLAPHASVSTSYQASLEAAQLSNIILQRREVNQGVWRMLEHATRSYVREANKQQNNSKCGSKEQRKYATELSELMARYTPYSTHKLSGQENDKHNSRSFWLWRLFHVLSRRFLWKDFKMHNLEESNIISTSFDVNIKKAQQNQCIGDSVTTNSVDINSSVNNNNEKSDSNNNNYNNNNEKSGKMRVSICKEMKTESHREQYLPQCVQQKLQIFSPTWWLKMFDKKVTVEINIKNCEEDNDDTDNGSTNNNNMKRKSYTALSSAKKKKKKNSNCIEKDILDEVNIVKSKGPLAICTGPLYYPIKSPSSSSLSSSSLLLSHVSNAIRVRGSSESVRRRLRRLEHKELHREQRKLFKCREILQQMSEEEFEEQEEEQKEKQKEEHVLQSSPKEQSREQLIDDEEVNEEQQSLRHQEEELEQFKQEECHLENEHYIEHENEHRTLFKWDNVNPSLKTEEEIKESSAQTPKFTPLHKLFTSFSRTGENVNSPLKNEEEQKWQGRSSSSSSLTSENNYSNNEVNCAKCNTSCSSYFWRNKLTKADSPPNRNNSKEGSTENMSDNNSINVNAEHLCTNHLETQNALHKNKYIKYRGKKELPPDATFMAIWDLHSHDHIAFVVPNKLRKRRQRKTKEIYNTAGEELINKSRKINNNKDENDYGGSNGANSSKPESNDAKTIYLENACEFELLSPVLPYIVEWNELEHIFTESMCELERRKHIKCWKLCNATHYQNNGKTLPHNKYVKNGDEGKANYDVVIDMPLLHIFPIQQAKWRLRTALPRLHEYVHRKLIEYRDQRQEKSNK